MFSLGLAGGLDPVHNQILDTPENYTYDGAAVLLKDGVVVAAMEEERLNRIKHSNKFPVNAIRFCLDRGGLRLGDVDRISYYVDEQSADTLLARLYLERSEIPRRFDARSLMQATIERELGCVVDPGRLRFYEHKLTHAACAMHQSGFAESLVYVIDNAGGLYRGARDDSGKVLLETIVLTEPAKSLQKLCHAVLPYLGLGLFEEYKALALAAHGDPGTLEAAVGTLYELLPDGDYRLHLHRAPKLIALVDPLRSGNDPSARHRDLAAALQRAMERIVFHVLAHHREASGLSRLCMAGGMAENIGTNSAVLGSGLFDEVFVHPVAYDAGCALGAALLASQEAGCSPPAGRVAEVRWGSDIGDAAGIAEAAAAWSGLLRVERRNDIARHAAELVAGGALVAWVQGRSDFGTHALGGRNVFADPRRADSRDRIHRALGRPESYRPLAAIVREEDLGDWCVLPPGVGALPFQTFAVEVRGERRPDIAGAMRSDGSACLQSVSRRHHGLIWQLLTDLKALNGSAAVLSASFNRSSEPTAETVDDAIVSFLDSRLDHLIIGDFAAAKCEGGWAGRLDLRMALPPHVQFVRTHGWAERRRRTVVGELRTATAPGARKPVTPLLGNLLAGLDDEAPLGELVARARLDDAGERALMDEIGALWSAGMITLRPRAVRPAA